MVLCGSGASTRELVPLLGAAHSAEYTHLQFGFGQWRNVDRPVMGTMREPHFSAAHTTLVAAPSEDARAPSGRLPVVLDLAAIETCDDLVRKVVALRTAGEAVHLRLPSAI
jgi:hypothetical protein